jgi:hypothetical protein
MAGAFASRRAAFTARPMATLALSGRVRGSEQGTMISWGLAGLQIGAVVLVLGLAEGFLAT